MIAWPAVLPLPHLDYSGGIRNATISSSLENGYIHRRSRFTSTFSTLQVNWVWTPDQLQTFREFFQASLGNGAAMFAIELKYPRNTTLEEWVTRFAGGYSCQHADGLWIVSSALDLVRRAILAARAEALAWSGYIVLPEGFGDSEQFTTVDGEDYYVRIP